MTHAGKCFAIQMAESLQSGLSLMMTNQWAASRMEILWRTFGIVSTRAWDLTYTPSCPFFEVEREKHTSGKTRANVSISLLTRSTVRAALG